jgi:chemotaxis protein methyltransferase CheR
MELVKQVAGIHLTEAKRPLVLNRLNRRLADLRLDMSAYAKLVTEDGDERGRMIDLLTTNHTAFNREQAHFDDLRDRVLPWVRKRQGNCARPRLRIWSAASSSGQEPYTIALTIHLALPDLINWDVGILATDISSRVIERAKRAEYSSEEVAPLSQNERRALFDPIDGERMRVKPALRSMVSFARLNLQGEWPMRGPFDLIFCRNVMIYFDNPTKETLVRRLHDLLVPGGSLYTGHTESLNNINHSYRLLRPSVYLREGGTA